MALEIKKGESPGEGLRRMAREQVENALEELAGRSGRKPPERIHEARKSIKKSRAVLRLGRDCFGPDAYETENVCLREVGRALSPMRDAEVCLATLSQLIKKLDIRLAKDRLASLRKPLLASRRKVRAGSAAFEEARAAAEGVLEQVRARAETWKLECEEWEGLEGGLRRVYRNNKRAFDLASTERTPDAYHEWRKQAKYLWYHLRILRPLWPKEIGSLADETRVLSDLLGEDHDLHVLRQTLSELVEDAKDKGTLEQISELAHELQRKLKEEAGTLALRLYAERPQAFAGRFGGFWKAWQAE